MDCSMKCILILVSVLVCSVYVCVHVCMRVVVYIYMRKDMNAALWCDMSRQVPGQVQALPHLYSSNRWSFYDDDDLGYC